MQGPATVIKDRISAQLVPLKPDAEYFLMPEGWAQKLRRNSWQRAKRWARQLPIIALQPAQTVASRWPRPGRPAIGTWVSQDEQYRFDALLRLANRHDELVWEALVPSKRCGN